MEAKHEHRPMYVALAYCGVYDAVLTPLLLDNPDLTPRYTEHPTAFTWLSGKRNGVVNSKGFRVTEFKGSGQKVLPFGKPVKVSGIKGEKDFFVDHPNEKAYSEIRFSQYGTG